MGRAPTKRALIYLSFAESMPDLCAMIHKFIRPCLITCHAPARAVYWVSYANLFVLLHGLAKLAININVFLVLATNGRWSYVLPTSIVAEKSGQVLSLIRRLGGRRILKILTEMSVSSVNIHDSFTQQPVRVIKASVLYAVTNNNRIKHTFSICDQWSQDMYHTHAHAHWKQDRK